MNSVYEKTQPYLLC